MYYVYVLLSLKDSGTYTGCTNNLQRRLKQHNNGLSYATRPRKPLRLIYFEAYLYKEDALLRERYLKTDWGCYYLNKVIKNTLKKINNSALAKIFAKRKFWRAGVVQFRPEADQPMAGTR